MSDLVLYECTARRRCRCPRFCYRYSLERCNDEGSWFQLPKLLDLNRLTRSVVRLHRYLIVSGENGSTLCDVNEPGATLGLVFSKAFQVYQILFAVYAQIFRTDGIYTPFLASTHVV